MNRLNNCTGGKLIAVVPKYKPADFWLSCPRNSPSYPECGIGQWFQKGYRHQRRNFATEYRQQLFKPIRVRLFDHMRENLVALRNICRILCVSSTETQTLWKATLKVQQNQWRFTFSSTHLFKKHVENSVSTFLLVVSHDYRNSVLTYKNMVCVHFKYQLVRAV